MGYRYLNLDDVLKIYELSSILSLLKSGEKNMFNVIYNKKNKLVYESLLDKLKGPDEKEVWKDFGYDQTFKTPEEFFDFLLKDTTEVKKDVGNEKSIKFYNSEGVGIITDDKLNKLIVINRRDYNIFLKIFFDNGIDMQNYFRSKILSKTPKWKKYWITSGNID